MTTVLVVEDTAFEQDLIVSYLEESGYKVISATNGQEALKKIEGRKPDVVITDLVMPGMSGLDIRPEKDTMVLRLTYTDSNPKRAQGVLNALGMRIK